MLQVASSMQRDQYVLASGAPDSTSGANNALYQNILTVIIESPTGTSPSYKVLYQTLLRSIIGLYQGPSQIALSISDIKIIARMIIWDTLTELYDLLTWNDGWNGYDARAPRYDAVTYADSWIVQLFLEVMDLDQDWIKPNISASGDGEVVFGWRNGTKRLTIYIGEQNAEYVRTWGPDINDEMDDGNADLTGARQSLWEWLIS